MLFVCTSCGTATTVLVIIEYIQGPTATSTTIKLVPSLEMPAITVCPKVPDAFDFDMIYNDIKGLLPDLNKESATDLIRFWLGGSGLENITPLVDFNRTYLDQLSKWWVYWVGAKVLRLLDLNSSKNVKPHFQVHRLVKQPWPQELFWPDDIQVWLQMRWFIPLLRVGW